MASARPASTPQLLASSAGAADLEFGRVLRTADPGPALDGPLTFLPAVGATPTAWRAAWDGWRQTILTPSLAPTLLQTAALATRGCAREMLALDRELDAALEPAARERSRAAGRCLLGRLAASRGERWLGKFRQWIDSGEMPAHFPVIYAGQHALFHLPPRLLVTAYAYWEWSAAGGPAPEFSGEVDALSRLAQSLLPALSSNYAVEHFPAASNDR